MKDDDDDDMGSSAREMLHHWPEERQGQQRYRSDDARDDPEGAASHQWTSAYFPVNGGKMEQVNSVVINDSNGGRVVPSVLYYNSLPAAAVAWAGHRSHQRSPVEVVTVKSQHCQLPETSI